ncbi:MAG: hypothetical protein JW904_12235 [Spirochaetales bacterium]|nr:hypothetical protein [Spirochaetales bacterium]
MKHTQRTLSFHFGVPGCILGILCMVLVSCPFIDREYDPFFLDEDRPYFEYNAASDYYYCLPWNYSREWNSRREYPLVIFLHGSGGAGNISYLNYLGYQDPDSTYINQIAYNFQTTHPSFVLIPQTAGSWNNQILMSEIESFKAAYRINEQRIYVIGYSMGGSGSYSLANAYCDDNGSLFAGIVRLAGQSQISVRDAIAEHTAVWMHTGLEDEAIRITTTREAYDFLKNHPVNLHAEESVAVYDVNGKSVATKTLTRGKNEVAKISEYADTGHGIVMLPAQDPEIMEWLFEQQIVY